MLTAIREGGTSRLCRGVVSATRSASRVPRARSGVSDADALEAPWEEGNGVSCVQAVERAYHAGGLIIVPDRDQGFSMEVVALRMKGRNCY